MKCGRYGHLKPECKTRIRRVWKEVKERTPRRGLGPLKGSTNGTGERERQTRQTPYINFRRGGTERGPDREPTHSSTKGRRNKGGSRSSKRDTGGDERGVDSAIHQGKS